MAPIFFGLGAARDCIQRWGMFVGDHCASAAENGEYVLASATVVDVSEPNRGVDVHRVIESFDQQRNDHLFQS